MPRNPEEQDSSLQNQVEDAGKKAGRFVGRKILNAIKKALKNPVILKIVLIIVGVIVALITIMLIWIYVKQAFIDFADAWKNSLQYVVEAATGQHIDHEEYDKWRGANGSVPEDPDLTENMIAGIKMARKCKKEWLELDYDKLDSSIKPYVDAYNQWKPMIDNRHLYVSPQDIIDVLEDCRDANKEMFRISAVSYGDHYWEKIVDPITGAVIDWVSHNDYDNYYVSDLGTGMDFNEAGFMVDSYFGNETSSNIEGEKDSHGVRRFASHWQDIIAACMFYSMNNKDKWDWGRTGDDPYSDEVQTAESNRTDTSKNASTDNYYLTADDINKIEDIFNYKTTYRYDAMKDGGRYYHYEDLASGKAAFHLFKEDKEPWAAQDSFYTTFVPISAVKETKNSWETITYTYTRTEDLPKDLKDWVYKIPGDTFVYPEGEYCTGRFDVIDPAPFIEAMKELNPHYYRDTPEGVVEAMKELNPHYYRDTPEGVVEAMKENAEKFVKDRDFKWAEEMIQEYTDDLSEMPAVKQEGKYDRLAMYTQLADDFTNGIVRINYQGTQYIDTNGREFEEQLQAIEDEIAAEYATYGLPKPTFVCESLGIQDFYPITSDLSAVPFRSYGVIFCTGNDGTGPNAGNGGKNINLTGSNTIVITPNNPSNTQHILVQGGDAEGYGTATVYDGALTNLFGTSDNMTLEEITAMLQYIQDKFDVVKADSSINFPGAAQAVYNWQQQTGQPVSAIFAFIIPEGTFASDDSSKSHASMWNFWNRSAGATSFTTRKPVIASPNGKWMDMKATYDGDFNAALIDDLNYVYDRYLKAGQNNYYLICFKGYGMPTTKEDADKAGPISHSFCPWWGSAYAKTGQSEDLYPNRLAAARIELLEAAGKNIATYGIGGTLQSCANWYLQNVDFYDKPSTTDDDNPVPYGADAPWQNVYYYNKSTKKVRADCSGFASAYVGALAPDQIVFIGSSASFALNTSSVGQALQSIGWSLHPASEFSSVDQIPEGAILVANGHVEIVVKVNNGRVSSFGWGKVQSSYPSTKNARMTFLGGKIFYGRKAYNYVWTY